jgi:hypothetical protein
MGAYHKACKFLDCQAWPPTLNSIVQFVLHSSRSGLAYSTVGSYFYAISYKCKLNQIHDPTSEFLVSKLLQGMGRLKYKADSRLPITKPVLQDIIRILPLVCTNAFETNLFSAAFSLAFYGLLRVGEVTVDTKKGDKHNTILSINHNKHSLLLSIRYSKTDQLVKSTVLEIHIQGGSTCPFQLVTKYIKVRPDGPGPLFRHFNLSPHKISIYMRPI